MAADEKHDGKKLMTLDSDAMGMAVQVNEMLFGILKRF